MVLIPTATFQMGSDRGGSGPVHAVRLRAYCIDRTEVTVTAYRACAGCTPPATDTSCNWPLPGREQHPINCVRFFDAEGYCRAVGKRLPTEAEWEYAARGPEGRTYPWGSTDPETQPCWHQSSTCAVGTHPAGDSWAGVQDMTGNVSEWTADWFGPYHASSVVEDDPTGPVAGTLRVTRGGDWVRNLLPPGLETVQRGSASPGSATPRVGFRCAR